MDSDRPTITLNDAPQPAAPPPAAQTVVDSLGRKLTLRELSLLQETDLIVAMPPPHANNSMALGRALLAARVASIDGEPMDIPLGAPSYRAMLQQVGKEGLTAVIIAVTPADEATSDKELAKN
ncbi:MAG TPA: hypothetical protein VGF92_07390 [Stellaceae bacterium]|jgi:hypothetical protein